MTRPNLRFHNLSVFEEDTAECVLAGLKENPKRLPFHLLYDEHGSALFDRICETPEYYITRTELQLLETHGAEMADRIQTPVTILEFGAGNMRKIRTLLSHFPDDVTYVPIDISREHLRKHALRLAGALPYLRVEAICADFSAAEDIENVVRFESRRVLFFPGSTIGNLEPRDAILFLMRARDFLGPRGQILIGVDLKKDPRLIEAAYNDAAGLTARFELNILTRLNRELDADFDLAKFRYFSRYNSLMGRVEMYLRSLENQTVSVAGENTRFRVDECLLTERSYKYSVKQFSKFASTAGFVSKRVWIDPDGLFSIHFLESQ